MRHNEVSDAVSDLSQLVWNCVYRELVVMREADDSSGSMVFSIRYTQLFHLFKPADASNAVIRLESCIKDILAWLVINLLKLNSSKTDLILLDTRQQLAKLKGFQIEIDGTFLQCKETVRYLGVTLDGPLTFEPHVNMICRTAFAYLLSFLAFVVASAMLIASCFSMS